MSLLELGGNKFTIPVGEVVLGSDAACAIPLSGAGVLPRHALLQGQADGQVIIRKATPAADVLINGVRLGAEPTPLLHGDKVEVGDHRSEEHTSELQSQSNLVCRLLLEKKKKNHHSSSTMCFLYV